VFYLAVTPRFFATDRQPRLSAAGPAQESDTTFRRLVVEKPFGTDLASAPRPTARLGAAASARREADLPDRPLSREGDGQNIMAFRFGNGIFEPIWNRDHIEHVQITAAETVGWSGAAASTTAPGRCATWLPTTCSSCCPCGDGGANSFDAEAVAHREGQGGRGGAQPDARGCGQGVVRGQYDAGTVLGKPAPPTAGAGRGAGQPHTRPSWR